MKEERYGMKIWYPITSRLISVTFYHLLRRGQKLLSITSDATRMEVYKLHRGRLALEYRGIPDETPDTNTIEFPLLEEVTHAEDLILVSAESAAAYQNRKWTDAVGLTRRRV